MEHSALGRNEILTHATIWMSLEDPMLSELSQTQQDRYSMCLLYEVLSQIQRQKVEWLLSKAGETHVWEVTGTENLRMKFLLGRRKRSGDGWWIFAQQCEFKVPELYI